MRNGGTLPGWPRVLRREFAAQYLGMSPSIFSREVEAGAFPPARALGRLLQSRDWISADRQTSGPKVYLI